MTDPYADIRPYRDDEVPDVLARLLADSELHDALASFQSARLHARWPGLARWLVRRALRRQLRSVRDVQSMQMVIKTYMDAMIESTSGGFTVSGLEQLDPARAYLFISNHRDIGPSPTMPCTRAGTTPCVSPLAITC